jgi:hypothetical protein
MRQTKLTPNEARILKLTDTLVRERLASLPQLPFSCAYIWGRIAIPRPNGHVVAVKHLFGFTSADQGKAQAAAESVPGVKITHFNMD